MPELVTNRALGEELQPGKVVEFQANPWIWTLSGGDPLDFCQFYGKRCVNFPEKTRSRQGLKFFLR